MKLTMLYQATIPLDQIISKIKRYKKIKIKYISSPIMNKINFVVSTKT